MIGRGKYFCVPAVLALAACSRPDTGAAPPATPTPAPLTATPTDPPPPAIPQLGTPPRLPPSARP